METAKLKRFSLFARRTLIEQVGTKLDVVLADGSAAGRERPKAVKDLQGQLEELGREQLLERVAYTWFNRFCALRYMDVNRYTRIGIVSPEIGKFQPEILAEAKMGHIDAELVPESTRQRVSDLLDGTFPSRDPQTEAYRLLLVAACNYYHSVMPFLFEPIADWTELLMPDDLLSGESILAYTREALLPINCSPEHTEENVEVIGWLYQFYISEKKDDVFAALKKGQKITAENIPAATQLFTPHWIVRYLVENSLGRLWMLNHAESKLLDRMDYYIRPEEPETDFLRIASPEEIKVCDPACGSGHMLTYAFDLLYAIYEEQGYPASDIPRLILENNLYGIEIDQRAGALAAFALTMKAREKYRRFLTKDNVVQPNICVLENIHIVPEDLAAYVNHVGRDQFPEALQTVVNQFKEADNFGSLIRPAVSDVTTLLEKLLHHPIAQDLFLSEVHQGLLKALTQTDYLRAKYHVVVANPPYMSAKGINPRLAEWLKECYEDVKSDVFSAFIVRNTELALPNGQLGFMSPFVWMFISSYEKLRDFLINFKTITSLVQLEYSGFVGATVPICAFTIQNAHRADFKGGYIRLSRFRGSENQGPKTLEAIKNPSCGWFYRASAADFTKIPGSPIAYWLGGDALKAFEQGKFLRDIATTRVGMATGDNDRFVRFWHEVSKLNIGFGLTREEAAVSHKRWFPYSNGGEARKWYANYLHVVNWEKDGNVLRTELHESGRIRAHNFNLDKIFKPGLTWSLINAHYNAIRILPEGFLFSSGAPSLFVHKTDELLVVCGYYNSVVTKHLLRAINPTLNNNSGDADKLPYCFTDKQKTLIRRVVRDAVSLAQADWDSYETSWDFTSLPLLNMQYLQPTIRASYEKLSAHWQTVTVEIQRLEEENNQVFMDAYGLNEELASEVPLSEVTLDCNPHYRYDPNKTEPELEALLLADTMREFVSYAVGCMFGRYSLDKPGLILANQGETVEDYRRQIPEPTFAPDEDNVIPLLDGDWFPDDISERFKAFLRITFGTEHYEDNLTFLENGLYPDNLQGKRRKTIRDYFLKEFYNHHVRMYKKRPIYWLFSSPKGTFNALIYMHRYRPDTVSIVLNDYLREFHAKLTAKAQHLQAVANSAAASSTDKAKALKEIAKLKKGLKELEDYEHKVLYPLAARQLEIDLDDGIKVNYNKFGKALKKVTGLTR